MLDLTDYNIVLGSQSSRRIELLKLIDLRFETKVCNVKENYPSNLKVDEIAEYLAEKKSNAFGELNNQELLITADTIVCLGEEVLGKPQNENEAIQMLRKLSGKQHEVITGVCIRSAQIQLVFSSQTSVRFKPLLEIEIKHYVSNYQPFDKAGSYGIQEWIGAVGVEQIQGSYFNVMGLPVHLLYEKLKGF